MEDITVKNAEIFCTEDFSLENYYILAEGVYYRPRQNKLEICSKPTFNYFTTTVSFLFYPQEDEVNLDKLKEAAEHTLKEKQQQKNESNGKAEADEVPQKKAGVEIKLSGISTGSSVKKSSVNEGEASEKIDTRIHHLLEIYENIINKNLKDTRFKLEAKNHWLIDDVGHKTIFGTDDSTRSELYTDLNGENLAQKLVDIQIAVIKTLQTLFKETNGAYPNQIRDFYLIKENLTPEQAQKFANHINPKFKALLKDKLLSSEFDEIRHLVTVDQEPIVTKSLKSEAVIGVGSSQIHRFGGK